MRIILDIPIMTSKLLRAVDGDPSSIAIAEIGAIVTDSREARAGDLFFALAVGVEDRARHIRDAAARGAVTVGDVDGASLRVADARRVLLEAARIYKEGLHRLCHTVGVTGSAGKTTATRFISRLLSDGHRVHSTVGNYNNIIGLSISVLCAPRDTEILVLEMGMNAEGEIRELAEAMCPDVCLITNIGTAHIGRLGSREAIARAKREIVTEACRVVVCPAGELLLDDIPCKQTYAIDDKADYSLIGRNFICREKIVGAPPLAEHLRPALCAAMAIATLIDGEVGDCTGKISDADGRTSTHRIRGITVIDDSYNSSAEAVLMMLDHLAGLAPPRAVLLSDMLELGEMAPALHFRVGEAVSEAGVDRLFVIGDYAEEVARGAIFRGFRGEIRIYPRGVSLREVAEDLLDGVDGGHLLIKGSHATGLYGIIEILKELENDWL